jgi:hypothetical protein
MTSNLLGGNSLTPKAATKESQQLACDERQRLGEVTEQEFGEELRRRLASSGLGDDDLVPPLGKTKERRTEDVLLRVGKARTHRLLEFRLLVRNMPAFFVFAHGRARAKSGLGFCSAGHRPVTFQTS